MQYHSVVLSLALCAVSAASLTAQGPMQVVPSGRGTSEVSIVPVDSAARAAAKPSIIRLDYGQPHLRGRKILTDSLVPYDKPWRTGANAATTLTTDVDLVVGRTNLPKGKYIVLTLPSHAGWKLLIQKEPAQPPADATYNPANDVARIDLTQTTLSAPLESFTMWLIPSREPGKPHGQLVLAWSNVSLSTDWAMK
jgi:hypothetical protein